MTQRGNKHQDFESLVKSGHIELTAASVFDVLIWQKCFLTLTASVNKIQSWQAFKIFKYWGTLYI